MISFRFHATLLVPVILLCLSSCIAVSLATAQAAIAAPPDTSHWDAHKYAEVGRSLVRERQPDEAVRILNEGIHRHPKVSELFAQRAAAYQMLSDYGNALADVEVALKDNPKNWEALVGRAHAFECLEQREKAVEAYSRAIAIRPAFELYRGRGINYMLKANYKKALPDFEKALAIGTKRQLRLFRVDLLDRRASCYSRLNQKEQAIADYTAALKLSPSWRGAYLHRAQVYESLGDYEQAVRDYTSSLDLRDADASVYGRRAAAYAKLGQYSNALADLKVAIYKDPDHSEFYFDRAKIYEKMGKTDLARADVEHGKNLEQEILDK